MDTNLLYCRQPIDVKDGISIFSEHNAYIANYDQISSDHLAYFFEDGTNPFMPDESAWKEMEASTVDMIKRYLPNGGKILDVGVGMGRLLEHFPEAERFGMDISMGYLQLAQKKGISTCLALIEDMPYCDRTFDVVVCTDVLEHVIDLNSSLKKIFRVLKDNGTLIIRVPYREDLKNYLTPGFPYHFVHLRNFDEYSLTMLFTKIFNCKVLAEQPVAYHSFAFGSFKGAIRIARMIRSTCKILPDFLAVRIRDLLLKPVEINFAVTNTQTIS